MLEWRVAPVHISVPAAALVVRAAPARELSALEWRLVLVPATVVDGVRVRVQVLRVARPPVLCGPTDTPHQVEVVAVELELEEAVAVAALAVPAGQVHFAEHLEVLQAAHPLFPQQPPTASVRPTADTDTSSIARDRGNKIRFGICTSCGSSLGGARSFVNSLGSGPSQRRG